MPFLGQDWRSPGEQWVKTTEGWERLLLWRLKLLENINENVIARLLKLVGTDYHTLWRPETGQYNSQPFVIIHKVASRELKMQTSICEMFNRLDISGAIKDPRRFNYVAKLLKLLIQHKLNSLSGSAQKQLFNVLEVFLNVVIKTQTNHRILADLLRDLDHALMEGQYDHIGSSSLWAKHIETTRRMQNTLHALEIKKREEDEGIKMSDLPDDCIRHILLRLSDHRDIINTGLTESRNYDLAEELSLWRGLCLFHFDNHQIVSLLKNNSNLNNFGTADWKCLYNRLSKRYGRRETYAEMLHMCQNCNSLFWEDHGHPCMITDVEPQSIPVMPHMCIDLFTV